MLPVAAALLWVPGALLGRALGLGPRWALAAAPALTWGLVALGAVAVPRAGLRWTTTTATGVLVLALLAALALGLLPRRPRRRGSPAPAGPDGARASLAGPALGVAVAALLVVAVAWRAGHRLGSVAQTWDAAYHANLTTLIAGSGDSDPVSAPSALASAGWRDVSTYYPDALHALAALVVRSTGAGSAVVLDVLAALVVGGVLPVAVAALAGSVAPSRRGAAAAVGAVVAVLPVAAPWDQWWRGVWSYGAALATALLVAALAVRALEGWLVPRRPVSAAAAVLLGAVGVAGLQPAGVVLAGVLVLGWALSRLTVAALATPPAEPADAARAGALRVRGGLAAAVVGTLLLPPLVLALARWSPALGSLAGYDYTTRPSTWTGVGQALTSVLGGVRRISGGYGFGLPPQGGQWLLAAVVLAAVVLLATSRATAWLAAAWALAVVAAVATVVPLGPVLAQVVGPAGGAAADLLRSVTLFFYNAPFRLMAVVAAVGSVVVGVAAARAADLLDRHVPRPRRSVVRAAAAGAAVLLAGSAALSTLEVAAPRLAAGYAPRVTAADQRAVMDRLAQVVREQPLPAGATVANDPVDGSAWLYSLHDLPVLFRHYAPGPLTPDAQLLLSRLDDVDTDPGVQQALRDLRVCYVYSGGRPVYASMRLAPGFTDLDLAASLEPVARSGSASAYRVLVPGTPCAPA
ncbi:DUF6541 family protein [Quadrisphaera setariae]|uniref:Uncharacterized protein n=1 Tax=Quadrisphaera setariae TaxID=2593304 RepID=A0A5C8ZM40_9ACTN|nr:DUF6541 family protein [Quadrisphaera setariae]TXR58046.1 hypothetical protein FMM08_02205 [Quadrisphaera setariae]